MMSKSTINPNIEYKLKRIAENLFLNQNERDKLFQMYINSEEDERDSIVNEIFKQSTIESIKIRHDLKQRIRRS
jgi:hypothetical protein